MNTVVYDYQTFCMQEFGGISRYFCELAARIHHIPGLRARIVAPLHFNHYLQDCAAPKLARYVPLRVMGRQRPRSLLNRLASPLLQLACRPSIVHRTYYMSQPRVPGARQVVTVFDMIHELFPQSFAPGDATSALKRARVQEADHVICISHSTARDLMRLWDVPVEKITVTHLGFSGAFSQSVRRGGARPGRPYLLYVGHRGGYKNFAVLLQAYLASERLQRDFDLVCFGGEPLDAAALAGLHTRDLREGALRRVGGSDADLARAYADAHAFVYPSLYEGFGIPPLEAMSCGCPVVCSDTSSLPEVVGDAAELFDPAQAASLCAALERVCLDESRRSELVAAGLARVPQFSWERCAAATAQAYQRLLAQ